MNSPGRGNSALKPPVLQPAGTSFGMKLTDGGTHISRTMMLAEIGRVLSAVPGCASRDEYAVAVLERNVTGKSTDSTRKKTLRHLRELYGLSLELPIFAAFRSLALHAPGALPQLALLVAWARDPLLRASTVPLLSATPGKVVEKSALEAAIEATFPNHYSALNIAKIARNASASWSQSGHLTGHATKVRTALAASPAALCLALLLGHAEGRSGEELFRSPWCRLLDLTPERARAVAVQAHREGLLDMKAIGSVVEVAFPKFQDLLAKAHEHH